MCLFGEGGGGEKIVTVEVFVQTSLLEHSCENVHTTVSLIGHQNVRTLVSLIGYQNAHSTVSLIGCPRF